MRRLLLPLVLLALWPLGARAGVPVLTQAFSSTSGSGSATALNPKGSTNCSVLFTSGGGATVTVLGSIDGTNYQTNAAFGTSGVIAAPSAGSMWGGNIQSFPQGFNISWTGNTGTLAGTMYCFGQNGPPITAFGYFSGINLPSVSAIYQLTFGTPVAATIDYNVSNTGKLSSSAPFCIGGSNSGACLYDDTTFGPLMVSTLEVKHTIAASTNLLISSLGPTLGACGLVGAEGDFGDVANMGSILAIGNSQTTTGPASGLCTGGSEPIVQDQLSYAANASLPHCNVASGPGSCNVSATVEYPDQCVANYDQANTTAAINTLYPIETNAATANTLKIYMGTSASGSQNLYAHYRC